MFPIIKTFYPNIILFFEEVRSKKTARRISSTRQAHAKCFCCSFKNYIMVQKRWGKEEKTLSLKWVFLMTVCFSPPVPIRFTRHLRAHFLKICNFRFFWLFRFFLQFIQTTFLIRSICDCSVSWLFQIRLNCFWYCSLRISLVIGLLMYSVST